MRGKRAEGKRKCVLVATRRKADGKVANHRIQLNPDTLSAKILARKNILFSQGEEIAKIKIISVVRKE